jgi:hypothetical protein
MSNCKSDHRGSLIAIAIGACVALITIIPSCLAVPL